jgi:hypothetical protein
MGTASASRVGEWVTSTARAVLADREDKISKIETASSSSSLLGQTHQRDEETLVDSRVIDASSVSLAAPITRPSGGRKGMVIAAASVAVIAGLVAMPRLVHRAPPPVAPASEAPAPEMPLPSAVVPRAPEPPAPSADPASTTSASASATSRAAPRARDRRATPARPAPDPTPAPAGDEDLFRSRR